MIPRGETQFVRSVQSRGPMYMHANEGHFVLGRWVLVDAEFLRQDVTSYVLPVPSRDISTGSCFCISNVNLMGAQTSQRSDEEPFETFRIFILTFIGRWKFCEHEKSGLVGTTLLFLMGRLPCVLFAAHHSCGG